MKQLQFPLLFSFLLLLAACGETTTEETPSYTDGTTETTSESENAGSNEAETRLEDAFAEEGEARTEFMMASIKWLDGSWQSFTDGGANDPQNSSFEEWKAPKMGVKMGFGYRMEEGFTKDGLDMQIRQGGQAGLEYVRGKEGEDGYALYQMKESTPKSITFENTEVKFPRTIKYSGEKEGLLTVTTSGVDDNGKAIEQTALFKPQSTAKGGKSGK